MKRARGGCFSGAGKSSIFGLYNLRKKRVFEGVLSTNVERGNEAKRQQGNEGEGGGKGNKAWRHRGNEKGAPPLP